MRGAVTVSLDQAFWKAYKVQVETKLNVKVSRRVQELMEQDMAKLQGKEPETATNYAELKSRHKVLVRRFDEVKTTLLKHGVYQKLMDLAEEHKLDFDGYSNVSEVIGGLLRAEWDGGKSDLALFINLLELCQEKELVLQQMGDVQSKKYLKD